MLEYFAIKKFRIDHQFDASVDSTSAPGEPLTPLLAPQDERFLEQVINQPEVNAEPENVIFNGQETPQASIPSDAPTQATAVNAPKTAAPAATAEGDWKETLRDKWGYLEALGVVTASRIEQAVVGKVKDKENDKNKGKGKEKTTEAQPAAGEASAAPSTLGVSTPGTATPSTPTAQSEIIREDQELTDVLERLHCAASNGTVFSSPSAATKLLIGKFTQIFKDLVNGVPTAYDDLISLFDSSSYIMEKTYSSLPSSIKQIIQSMPDKMTPEVLRTLAATSPVVANASRMGLKEIVTTPGVLASLLKSIVQVLRTRFPMLMGGGVAVSLGVFVLFFGLWYCYKRGKETREATEESERMQEFGVERIETEKEIERKKKDKEKAERKKAEEERAGPAQKRWWHLT